MPYLEMVPVCPFCSVLFCSVLFCSGDDDYEDDDDDDETMCKSEDQKNDVGGDER